VQLLVLAGDHEVGLGDDAHAAAALVDHRHARQIGFAQNADDLLDRIRDRHDRHVGIHDVPHRQRHGARL
jgi:hypothetical protein